VRLIVIYTYNTALNTKIRSIYSMKISYNTQNLQKGSGRKPSKAVHFVAVKIHGAHKNRGSLLWMITMAGINRYD